MNTARWLTLWTVSSKPYPDLQNENGLPEKQIREMLQKETWLNAQDALELGFIDEIVTPVRVAASLDISGLKSVPKEVIDMTTTTVETQAAATDAKAELKRIAEIKTGNQIQHCSRYSRKLDRHRHQLERCSCSCVGYAGKAGRKRPMLVTEPCATTMMAVHRGG